MNSPENNRDDADEPKIPETEIRDSDDVDSGETGLGETGLGDAGLGETGLGETGLGDAVLGNAVGLNRNEPVAVTQLLAQAAGGDKSAVEELLPLVYAQLRAVAQLRMATERSGHTLQATALVHEAYLKLVGPREVPWQNQAHFYSAAAEAMRRILLDYAKSRGRRKRGGDKSCVPLNVADLAETGNPEEILALDEALCRLEEHEPEAAKVVRLRFYAGLSVDQTAEALDLSPRTVDRRWKFARAWLFRELD
jgi:RNA polymerase sigma factor (TIGR02999 family)